MRVNFWKGALDLKLLLFLQHLSYNYLRFLDGGASQDPLVLQNWFTHTVALIHSEESLLPLCVVFFLPLSGASSYSHPKLVLIHRQEPSAFLDALASLDF